MRAASGLGHGFTFSPGTPRSRIGHPASIASRSTSASPARSHTKNSTLPVGPGSGLAVTARAPQPRRAPPAATRRRRPPQCRVADHSALAEPFLADLELRLDHQHQVAVGPGDADERVQHERQRDERQVPDDEVDRPADQVRRRARGRWCRRAPDPRVVAQRPDELAVARRRRRPPRAAPARSSTSVNPRWTRRRRGTGGPPPQPARAGTRQARRPACAPPGSRSRVGRGRRARRGRRRRSPRSPAWWRPSGPRSPVPPRSARARARASGPVRGVRARRPASVAEAPMLSPGWPERRARRPR